MHTHRKSHGCCEASGRHHARAGSGGCCGLPRHFMTKAERREALESYRDQLKNELTGVEERLAELSA